MKQVISVSGLVVRRTASFLVAIDAFETHAGQITCITGPNGSGKTTFIEALVGLLKPAEGAISIAGVPVSGNLQAHKKLLGFVPDDDEWFIKGLSAGEYLRLLAGVYKDAGVTSNIDARSKDLAARLHFTAFDQLVSQLSHGNRKKVQIIAGLMHNPEVLVVDELRNGLDPIAIIEAERLLKDTVKVGTSVIATTHDLWWAERLADSLLLLVDGKPVLQDQTKKIVKQYGHLEKAFMKLTGME